MKAATSRAALLQEAAACASGLRGVIATLEREADNGAPLDGELARLQARIGLLIDHQQERILIRSLPKDTDLCDIDFVPPFRFRSASR